MPVQEPLDPVQHKLLMDLALAWRNSTTGSRRSFRAVSMLPYWPALQFSHPNLPAPIEIQRFDFDVLEELGFVRLSKPYGTGLGQNAFRIEFIVTNAGLEHARRSETSTAEGTAVRNGAGDVVASRGVGDAGGARQVLDDDELDELLDEGEKELLVALYDAWQLHPQAFVFPPWGLDTPTLSQDAPSVVRLTPSASQLRTLAEANLISLTTPSPPTRKGSAPGGSVDPTLVGRRYYQCLKNRNRRNDALDEDERPSNEGVPPMVDREPTSSQRGQSDERGRDNPQTRPLQRRQDVTLPDPDLREQLNVSQQQWDFVRSQGLPVETSPLPQPKGDNQRPNRSELTAPSAARETAQPSSAPKPVPRVFIGSSSEGLRIARAIQANLDAADAAECVVWDQGVFGLAQGTLDALVDEAATHDFAVLVLTPDDVVEKRGQSGASPRDNVLFELGLFMGKLGRDRTFMVARRNNELQLPSDLAGLVRGRFREHSSGNMRAALGPFCSELEDIIRDRGIRPERQHQDAL